MGLRSFVRRFRRDTRGIASVEFVIFLFPMLLIFFAIIQFGSLFYNYSHMQNVARDAARRLAVDQSLDANGGGLVPCPGAAGTAAEVACDLIDLPGTIQVLTCYDNVEGVGPGHNSVNPRMDANVQVVVGMPDLTFVDMLGVGEGRNVTARASHRVEEPKSFFLDPIGDNNCPF